MSCSAVYIGRASLSRGQGGPHEYAEAVHLYELLSEATKILLRKVRKSQLRLAWEATKSYRNFCSNATEASTFCWNLTGRSVVQFCASCASFTTSSKFSKWKPPRETDSITTSFPACFALTFQENLCKELLLCCFRSMTRIAKCTTLCLQRNSHMLSIFRWFSRSTSKLFRATSSRRKNWTLYSCCESWNRKTANTWQNYRSLPFRWWLRACLT